MAHAIIKKVTSEVKRIVKILAHVWKVVGKRLFTMMSALIGEKGDLVHWTVRVYPETVV